MNNNGVNNINQQTNDNSQPTLAPMAGVKIAPAIEGPVNASNPQTASSSNASLVQPTQPVTPGVNTIQPQPAAVPQPMIMPAYTQTPQITPSPQMPTNINATLPPQPKTKPEEFVPSGPVVVNKKKTNWAPILLLITIGLTIYIVINQKNQNMKIQELNYKCTPITASNKEIELDLNSTLVQDLYSKVYTNIREDMAEPNFNENMKIYLAYRQILDQDKYSSNCNLFSNVAMEPYVCEDTQNVKPLAIKEETMIREIKKLYGENTNLQLRNIQLGNSCIVGYQYIPKRGEFVQGKCVNNIAVLVKVEKELVSAKSTRNTIVLKEKVKYHENEKVSLPEYLKSGYYYYKFKLDMNYNYVLLDKTYESFYDN